MFAPLIRLYWRFRFRSLKQTIAAMEKCMRQHPSYGVRVYCAQTGPIRLRLKSASLRARQMPEPQRTKFIIHLIAQMYLLSASYSGWMDRACRLIGAPQDFHDYYIRTLEHYNRNLERSLQELIVIYNRKEGSAYSMADFLNQPLSPGIVDLLSFHEEMLHEAEVSKATSPDIQALELCHFEMELAFLTIGIDFLELKAGTSYFKSLATLDQLLRIDPVGSLTSNMKLMIPTGTRTLSDIEAMMQTAYERSV